MTKKIRDYTDRYLKIREVSDWPNALNGLQVENSGRVTKIGAAVDAGLDTIEAAVVGGVDLLIVHHGLFWSGAQTFTGALYRKIRIAMENDLAIYSAHLPLDLHPVVGNNVLLCQALGFKKTSAFFLEKGQMIGRKANVRLTRDELAARIGMAVGGEVRVCAGGPAVCRRIGVVTGGAGAEVQRAYDEGVDTFITGEGPHWSFVLARELGLNVFYGGHYATETFGVKALAAHLSAKFAFPWEFIDRPTGL
ncbi:MAG: Nif3-like dinuclear metal center hexameric protein [Verrucomicrobiota bacterium]|nr:Nif3-like dinuclear metal center hexameric protein [Verrucomicrobiota bacterium]